MHKPDPVETILARLMPPGLSDEGLRGMEDMLDELAGQTPSVEITAPSAKPWPRRMMVGGIAAAGVAIAMVFPLSKSEAPIAANTVEETASGFVLVGESDRIESTIDEGWLEDSDGSAMRAMRLMVVEENSIRDEETGIVMQVSAPREEILLMPVSAF